MSLVAEHRFPRPELPLPEPMPDGVGRRGLALSAVLHLVLGSLFILGLPTLFHPPRPQEMPIAVELVTIAPEPERRTPTPTARAARPSP